MNHYRTPLSKVKGLGVSNGATEIFLWQRISALALIPLTVWILISLILLPTASYDDFVLWVKSPFNTILLVSMIMMGFYHAQIGIQIILDDYIAHYYTRLVCVLLLKLVSLLMSVIGLFSVLNIVFKA